MSDYVSIKSWSEEDRPREKLALKGREALSDAELMAILIGSGSKDKSAVELSREILRAASDNLHELSKWEIADLIQYKGIGEAKAITIVAALELGRRKLLTEPTKRRQITTSQDAYECIYPILADLNHEEFWVIFCNANNRVISKKRFSQGGINQTVVDIRIILKAAINQLCSSIVLVHNHPSGNLKPSNADRQITDKIKNAVKHFDIKLLDHIIIAQGSYYSFTDEGML